VTRSIAAVIEQMNDADGIIWPMSIAPYEVCVIPLGVGDELAACAEGLAEALAAAGVEVVLDDRDERAGVKFADADLIGWPLQVVVGKRGLEAGVVELKVRNGMVKSELALKGAAAELVAMVEAERALYR